MYVSMEAGAVMARAMDAGMMHLYRVMDWPDLPIGVDMPRHVWPGRGLSAVGRVTNISAMVRGMARVYDVG
jgi:hypothetical protein